MILAETAMHIAGNEVDLNESGPLSSQRTVLAHCAVYCMYLVLAAYHEVSHVHFLGVHRPTINVMHMQLERTPN